MAVDMTARARIPGTKKSTGAAVGVDTTETREKKRRNTTGIPMVSSKVSPRRSVMKTSALVCAASGRTAPPSVMAGAAAERCFRRGPRPSPSRPAPRSSEPAPRSRYRRPRMTAPDRRRPDRVEVDVFEGPPDGEVAERHTHPGQPGGDGRRARRTGGAARPRPGSAPATSRPRRCPGRPPRRGRRCRAREWLRR